MTSDGDSTPLAWRLDPADAPARLGVAAGDAESVGVSRAGPAGAPWDLRLFGALRAAAGSQRLRFLARAATPECVGLAVVRRSDPRQVWGRATILALTTEWRAYCHEFVVEDADDLQLVLGLGAGTGDFRLSELGLVPLDRPIWTLDPVSGAAVRLETSVAEGAPVRVERRAADQPLFAVELRQPQQLLAGNYRISFECRGEPASFAVTLKDLADADAAWLATVQAVDREWTSVLYEFTLTRPLNGEWVWGLGGADGDFELRGLECRRLDRPTWHFDLAPGVCARVTECPATPLGVRVENPRGPADAWDIQLRTTARLAPGHYRVACRTRAERAGRLALTMQGGPDASSSGGETWEFPVGPTWDTPIREFRCDAATEFALALALGSANSWIDVAELGFQALDRPAGETIAREPDAVWLAALPASPNGVRVMRRVKQIDRWEAVFRIRWQFPAGFYRARFRLRTPPGETPAFVMRQFPQARGWSLPTIPSDLQGCECFGEFAVFQSGSSEWIWAFGGSDQPAELDQIACEPLTRPPLWLGHAKDQIVAWRPDDTFAEGVCVTRPAEEPDVGGIGLHQEVRLPPGPCRLSCRLSATDPTTIELWALHVRPDELAVRQPKHHLTIGPAARRVCYEVEIPPSGEFRAIWGLGGGGGEVRLGDIRWEILPRPPWTLHQPRGSTMALEPLDDSLAGLRVVSEASLEAAWDAQLVTSWQLPPGPHALLLRLCAAQATVIHGLWVSTADESVVWSRRGSLAADQTRTWYHELALDRPTNLELRLDLSRLAGALELIEVDCRPLSRPPFVLHQPPDGSLVLVPVGARGEALRVEGEFGSACAPWEVLLEQRWPLAAGVHALSLELETDETGNVPLLLVSRRQGLPCGARIVSFEARCPERVRFELALPEPDEVALLIDLAAVTGGLDVRGLSAAPLARPPLAIHASPNAQGWLETPADAPQGARVVRTGPPVAPWDFQLAAPLEERSGWWRLTFRARADRPFRAPLIVSTIDGQRPLAALALVDLTPEPRTAVYEFPLPEQVPAQVSWGLGQLEGAADWLELALTPLARRPWHLHEENLARAQLVPPAEASETGLRVEIFETQGNPLDLLLCSARLAVRRGARYRLAFAARADRPRPLTLGLAQAGPPWERIGLRERIDVTSDWQRWAYEFTATAEEPAAEFYFSLGHAATAVEFRDLVAEELLE